MARCLRFVILGAVALSCQRTPPPPAYEPSPGATLAPVLQKTQESVPVATPEPQPAALVAGAFSESKRAAADRLVAIGDLHGDLSATRRAFQLGGATDAQDHWVGGKLVVVQTGDVLDRGDDERAILEFLDKQEAAAKKAGGAIYRLNGNHELMNVQGDFRYVSAQGFKSFAGETGAASAAVADLAPEQQGRAKAFFPGGRIANKLAEFPEVLMVGDTVFTHGGLEPKFVQYGLDRVNREVSQWMRGQAPLPNALLADDTPYWSRIFGGHGGKRHACQVLDQVLAALGAAHMVVGHTPQKEGITFDCNDKLARIDVGLSAYYGSNPTEVLEITAGHLRALRGAAAEKPARAEHPAN